MEVMWSDAKLSFSSARHNDSRLFGEIWKRGYDGCYTQVKTTVREWRSEGRERAFVRFEMAPGEMAQMDWVHFGQLGRQMSV